MGKGIGVPFVADVSGFIAGTDQIETSLAGVSTSLDDVGAHAQSTEVVHKRAFSSIATDAATTGDKIEHELGQSFDAVAVDAHEAATKAGTALTDELGQTVVTKGKTTVKGAGKAIGGQLSQSIGQGVSAGTGDVTSSVEGVVGNILPALGVAGAVIGVGALIVGNIIGGINANKAKALAAAHKFGDDVATALRDGVVSQAETESIVTSALGVDNINDALPKLAKFAKATGQTIAQVYGDVATGSKDSIAKLTAFADAHSKQVVTQGGRAGASVGTVYDAAGQSALDLAKTIERSNAAIATGTQLATEYGQIVQAGADAWGGVGKAIQNASRQAGNAAKIKGDKRFLNP